MCDERVSSLQDTLQSLGSKVPKIILQTLEKIYPQVGNVQNIDTVKAENDVDAEEDFIGIKMDEIYAPSAFSVNMTEPENCLDVLKAEPSSYSETCVTSSCDGNHVGNNEEVRNVQEDDPLLMPPVIKVEHENCMDLLKVEPGSYNETCLTSSHDGSEVLSVNVEEATNVQEEDDPLQISLPVIKAEYESTRTKHQVSHDEGCVYACDICHQSCPIQSAQRAHCCLYSGERLYSCDACKKSFDAQSNLKVHQCICSGGNPLACDLCTKALKEDSNVNQHQCLQSGEHSDGGVCNMSVSNKSDLDRHQHPQSSKGPYSCDVCDKAFSRCDHLIQHQCIHKRPCHSLSG
ncbi:zinc finger and SCAN domain-containing protein 12 isoform X3 [Cryptotermes secundus]|uniref:zinc finger and SCAN domain-containing protein 12 isoform X3 n=1 Tax=Cryptotermes secundus TaxID=105785 RepID=UPI000CD7B5CA|nr:zinc finger and SCAN domain-containing protein 12 isoform X3 [Cryptotermes secundus]